MLRCNNATSSVPCASYEEINTYISSRRFGLVTLFNFIDYDTVDPFKGPLKTAFQWVELNAINYTKESYISSRISLKQHRIELEDSWFQIMTEPEVFNFLNINEAAKTSVGLLRSPHEEDIIMN